MLRHKYTYKNGTANLGSPVYSDIGVIYAGNLLRISICFLASATLGPAVTLR